MEPLEEGILLVRALFRFRCALWGTTHEEYATMRKIMTAQGRMLAESVEDEALRAFVEEDPNFKPNMTEEHYRRSKEMLSDPEFIKRMHELEEEFHQHDDSDPNDLLKS